MEKMVDRLGEDHDNARLLAEKLSEVEGISIDPAKVCTNVLFLEVTKPGMSAPDLSAASKLQRVLAGLSTRAGSTC